MSKRQEKIEARKAEQQAFIAERRKMQLAIFQANFDIGMKLYEDNKDKMSAEEIELVEVEIKRNQELLDKLKNEINQGTQA
jgi:cob(I)alamin adenosyltransferase